MDFHWEMLAGNSNIKAICKDENGRERGGVEKMGRSSKHLRPFVYVTIGEWTGTLTPGWAFMRDCTSMEEAKREVEAFWAAQKDEAQS